MSGNCVFDNSDYEFEGNINIRHEIDFYFILNGFSLNGVLKHKGNRIYTELCRAFFQNSTSVRMEPGNFMLANDPESPGSSVNCSRKKSKW